MKSELGVSVRKKVLICGGTGFIGLNIVKMYASDGQYDVHAVRYSRPEVAINGVTWHQGDLKDPVRVKQLLVGVDLLIQAAATTSGIKDIALRPSIHVTDNAVMNSYIFREAVESCVNHVIFFSCTVMYHSSPSLLKEADFDPSKDLHPKYFGVGHTKLYLEKMCEFYSRIGETKFTTIRHSNVYGPHDKFDLERSHFFGATITKVMLADKEIVVWGSGQEARDLLYVDDLSHFVKLVAERQVECFKLYNCGSGQAIRIKDLVQRIIKVSDKALTIRYDHDKPSVDTALALDCTLAYEELGWRAAVSLDEGILRTMNWWKNNCQNLLEGTNERIVA